MSKLIIPLPPLLLCIQVGPQAVGFFSRENASWALQVHWVINLIIQCQKKKLHGTEIQRSKIGKKNSKQKFPSFSKVVLCYINKAIKLLTARSHFHLPPPQEQFDQK